VERYLSLSRLIRGIRRPSLWLILALLILITFSYYGEAFEFPAFLIQIISTLGLSRHVFERILYLAPIVWAGFIFGSRGAFITSLAALACMLPRAIFISEHPRDALFETSAVFIIGNVLSISFSALRKEREYRDQLEVTQQELRTSEERYRELFESASDAIWLHDLEVNIVAANKATATLTGYSLKELSMVKSDHLFTEDCLKSIKQIEDSLLENGTPGYLSEVKIIKKNRGETHVQLSTSPVFSNGQIVGFQHIARDITEQKRMQENLSFYLHQVTKVQEEERKRISHELHDDTIQSLIVLSRKLDTLASSSKRLSEDDRLQLEELWQQTNNIMQGIRRLSQDLRPAELERLGLLATLEWLASDVAEYSGIEIKVNVIGSKQRLPEETELELFRIIQEALRNVWRHSQATRAEITVEFNHDKTKITVSDNGKGFDIPQRIGDLAKDGKLGLAGMQERIRLIGATLKVKSQPGKGTSITVELRT
jgi:PAS domain S-box-containing protein